MSNYGNYTAEPPARQRVFGDWPLGRYAAACARFDAARRELDRARAEGDAEAFRLAEWDYQAALAEERECCGAVAAMVRVGLPLALPATDTIIEMRAELAELRERAHQVEALRPDLEVVAGEVLKLVRAAASGGAP